MLNIYRDIAKKRVFDSMVDAEFTNAIHKIEHSYSIPPIGIMSNRDCNNLEYRLVGNYENSLMRIYECYDKLLGLTIPPFSSNVFYEVITKLEDDDHAKNIALILMGRESFYGLSLTSAITDRQGVKDFFSRYETISELGHSDCCVVM
jgi:hypothetical protein